MTHPVSRISGLVALGFLTLVVLTACTKPATNAHAEAEAYIRAHVSELSPTKAVLGGTFYVTSIDWEDEDTAVVSYEDGHIALQGRTTVELNGGEVRVSNFTMIETEGTSSSATSANTSNPNERPRAKEGEFCGGIAGFMCEDGLHCQYEGNYPDAGGVCVK